MKQQKPETADQERKRPTTSGGIQPKHHAPKTRAASQIRRKKIVKAILDGKTRKEAGIAAGLSPKSAESQVSQILSEPNVKTSLLQALEAAGLTDADIAQQQIALLNGRKYLPVRGDPGNISSAAPGDVPGYIAVPDLQAKSKALEMIYRMSGAYVEKHEMDIKRPINIVIRKFCSPEEGKEDSLVGCSTA